MKMKKIKFEIKILEKIKNNLEKLEILIKTFQF